MKKCPFCAEEIVREVSICPFCEKTIAAEKEYSENVSEKIEAKSEGFKFPMNSIISYILSLVFVSIGFYKMWAYNSGEDYPFRAVNAYVGGDAYNYIINSNYAVGYFVLALTFVLWGSTFAIIKAITLKD